MWKKYRMRIKNIKKYIRNAGNIFLCLCLILCLGACSVENKETIEAVPENQELLNNTQPKLEPVREGILTIPVPHNPLIGVNGEKATPLTVTTKEMLNMFSLVYEPLLRCDANNTLISSLAEKWSCDSTGYVWTFELRKNITWHNGGVLTADDVIYTINQINALGENCYYSGVSDVVASVEKLDIYTISVTMNQKGIVPLYEMCFPVMQRGEENWVGTGPYELLSATEEVIRLTVNEDWWKQKPYIDRVICLARESNDVALASYGAGQLNFVPTSSLAAGKYREEDITAVVDVSTQEMETVLFNFENTILQDIDVRKAIAYAIDRSAIISNVYLDHAVLSDVPVPVNAYYYDAANRVYDYNINMAETLLNEAGWRDIDNDGILEKNGNRNQELKLTLLVSESAENSLRKSAATIIAEQLLELGIVVEIKTAEFSLNQEGKTNFEERLADGEFDIALVGFNVAKSGDLKKYLSRSGSNNFGAYDNSRMELLLDAVAQAVDEKELRNVHAKLQQFFIEDLPFIVLYFRTNSIVCDSALQGVENVYEPDIFRTVDKWYIETTGS